MTPTHYAYQRGETLRQIKLLSVPSEVATRRLPQGSEKVAAASVSFQPGFPSQRSARPLRGQDSYPGPAWPLAGSRPTRRAARYISFAAYSSIVPPARSDNPREEPTHRSAHSCSSICGTDVRPG